MECTGVVRIVSDDTVSFFKDATMSVSYVQKVLIRCPLLKKDEVVHLLETVFSGRLIHILFSSECCNSLIVLFLLVLGQKGALCNR